MIEQYSNPWFSVIKDGKYHYIKEVGSDNGAVILVESDNDYIFVGVRRAAHGFKEQIEAPRGYGEIDESSFEVALRELYEETGCSIEKSQLEKLGVVKPNSAILASEVDVFYARVSDWQFISEHDCEVESVVKISKDEIKDSIRKGLITDAFTLSAFTLLWCKHP